MAQAVFARGRVGRIILRDTSDDGTVILLSCEEVDPEAPEGVPIAPDPEGSGEDDDNGEVWPTIRFMIRRAEGGPEAEALAVHPQPFRLEIDVSDLPGGVLPFDNDRFLDHVHELVAGGVEKTEITRGSAPDWGFRGEQRARAR